MLGGNVNNLLRLPSGSTIVENNLISAQPPFAHGQLLIAIKLANGVLLEGVWDDHSHVATLYAYEPDDNLKSRPIRHRLVPIPSWLPAMTNAMAWTIAFNEQGAC
jgi:hypothetical protein